MNEQILQELKKWQQFEAQNKIISPDIFTQMEKLQQVPLSLLWLGHNEESGKLIDAFLNLQFFKGFADNIHGVQFEFEYNDSISYEATFTNGPNQKLDEVTLEKIFFAKESVWQILRGQVQKITIGAPNDMLKWLNVKYCPANQVAKLPSKEQHAWIICFLNEKAEPEQAVMNTLWLSTSIQLILNDVKELLALKQAFKTKEQVEQHIFKTSLQKLNYNAIPFFEKLTLTLSKRMQKMQTAKSLNEEITYLLNAERVKIYFESLSNLQLQNTLQITKLLNDLELLQQIGEGKQITAELNELKNVFQTNIEQALTAYESEYHKFQQTVNSFDEAQQQFNKVMPRANGLHITKTQYKEIMFANRLYNQQATQISEQLDVLKAQRANLKSNILSFEKMLNAFLANAQKGISEKQKAILNSKEAKIKQNVFRKQLALKQSLTHLISLNEASNISDEWINERLVALSKTTENVEQLVPLYAEQGNAPAIAIKVAIPSIKAKLPKKPKEIILDKAALKTTIKSNAKVWTVSILLAAIYIGGNILYFSTSSISNAFSKDVEESALAVIEQEEISEDGISDDQLIEFSRSMLWKYLQLSQHRNFEEIEPYLDTDSNIHLQMKERTKGRIEHASYAVEEFENISIRKKTTQEAYTLISKVLIRKSPYSGGRKTYGEYYLYTVLDTEDPFNIKLQLLQLEDELLD
ncbi:hypothetical protein [Caryophanon tenue]|uniref:Uncharacterized protein n=1 Tax=Caryophanon tenue TaxID=33978 RepID=A0A1C0YBM8_9BACL|nr:hypothetical protein [Caryophanon tenue]OCS84582.1 hypothetical protein A6M13_03110 [Caryophanon tenue]